MRVLQHNVIDWFENVSPDFLSEAKYQTDYRGLSKAIEYDARPGLIKSPNVNGAKKIILPESFLQYLWSLCYAYITLLEEGVGRPVREQRYTGQLDVDNPLVAEAIECIHAARELFTVDNPQRYHTLPNPEIPTQANSALVGMANGIFCSAASFVLLHEFAHHELSHLSYDPTPEQEKEDERNADARAIDHILKGFGPDSKKDHTNRHGLMLGMASILLAKEKLDGGSVHPDPDERIANCIRRLKFTDEEDWLAACLIPKLWVLMYGKDLSIQRPNSWMETFYRLLQSMKQGSLKQP